MTDLEHLISLLAKRSVKHGNFILASGQSSDTYIDARLTSMSPEGLALIGPLGLARIRTEIWDADSIGGMTIGADPISYAISYASTFKPPLLRAFTVRKEIKTHGTGKQIEGPFQNGDHVVVIEDVITTGGSALRAITAVLEAGGTVSGVLALVDREEGGREILESEGYQVISLISISQIVAATSSDPML